MTDEETGEIQIAADAQRAQLASIESRARYLAITLKACKAESPVEAAHISEAIGQAMLAVRHIEDARMRLGKVLQYAVQGGVEYGGKPPG